MDRHETPVPACSSAPKARFHSIRTPASPLMINLSLAIVPPLRDGVVTQHHWLTPVQFLDYDDLYGWCRRQSGTSQPAT
jgi:hypothetical protein